jgi:alkanesulfonate monooxygenase SsuD/methylene tetrahydromethanopterin reductase-like flavin-dependent oxidoreductase (luciferase family)
MAAVSVVAADTDAEARRLFSSLQQQFVALHRGQPIQLQPPVDDMDARLTPHERYSLEHTLRYAIVGGPDTVRERLAAFVGETNADEVIVTANIHDHAARVRSYEILAEVALLSS